MHDEPDHFPFAPGGAPRCFAVIPCAGHGSRAGLDHPKQYQVLAGQRLIDHTLDALAAVARLAGVCVVLAPHDDTCWPDRPGVHLCRVGGATRAHSVFNGLDALQTYGVRDQDWVLVHDAARCLVTPVQINALLDACWRDDVGGLLALPLPDTLKVAVATASADRVQGTIDRSDKWLAQTPQMFRWGALRAALQRGLDTDLAGITDEASAMEAMGLRPRLVRGSAQNFKVTYPEDFALAEALLLQRQADAACAAAEPCMENPR